MHPAIRHIPGPCVTYYHEHVWTVERVHFAIDRAILRCEACGAASQSIATHKARALYGQLVTGVTQRIYNPHQFPDHLLDPQAPWRT